MKNRFLLFTAALVLVAYSFTFAAPTKPQEKVLRHVVLVKFKKDTKPEDTQKIVDAFRTLPGKIDAIVDFEFGTDVSVEKRNQGFTHCFLVTFHDAKGRDTYLVHPAHEDFKKGALPFVDQVLVVDYLANR